MATIRQLIREQSKLQGVQQWVVEKDYAISYLLKAISMTDDLGDTLVLKGGTALRKLYFRDYRFSEDLDYSTREIGLVAELDTKISRAVMNAEGLLQENGPFRIEYEPLVLRKPHPGGQSSYIVRVQFPDHRQPICRLKVEITIDEPVLLKPEYRSIMHEFPENLAGKAHVYQLQEIIAEKLRALLQSLDRIKDRGWGAGRVSRDYYDLWYILKSIDLSGEELVNLTRKKSTHRSVQANSVDDFFSLALQEIARRQWEKQLRIFVPTAPDADVVLKETKIIVEDLWK
jgi:predicted nucleotidyltransferase component of viral defense system